MILRPLIQVHLHEGDLHAHLVIQSRDGYRPPTTHEPPVFTIVGIKAGEQGICKTVVNGIRDEARRWSANLGAGWQAFEVTAIWNIRGYPVKAATGSLIHHPGGSE